MLFSGIQGSGKTTLAKILINKLDINPGDVLEINASQQRGIDVVRDNILNFTSTWPFGKFKIVFLDEADYMTPDAQATLRGVMEKYSNSCRFILTCNYPHKIIPAIHSRCQGFHFDELEETEFTARMAEILINEKVDFELEVLDNFVRKILYQLV